MSVVGLILTRQGLFIRRILVSVRRVPWRLSVKGFKPCQPTSLCLMYHAACKIEFQPFKQVVLRPMTMETRCSQTYDNGNAMFQSYLSKIFKKKNRLKIRSYRRHGEHGEKKMFVFLGLFFHAAVLVRGGTCAFTLKIVNTLIKNSSRDD